MACVRTRPESGDAVTAIARNMKTSMQTIMRVRRDVVGV